MNFKKAIKIIVSSLILIIMTPNLFSQTKDDLNDKVKKLEKDIKKAENLLKETAKNKDATINEINLLQAQISQRQALIITYEQQLSLINKDIKSNKKDINSLQTDLENQRKEYADLLVLMYKNRDNLDNLLFVFSSEDFGQALRRLRYIREFKEQIKQTMTEIEYSKSQIKNKLAKNESDKAKKQKLIDNQKDEKEKLQKDKKILDGKVAKLKKKESSIKKEIAAKNKEADELQKKIKQIIAEETRKAQVRNNTAAGSNKTSIDFTLSKNFESNKGKLPWPCEGIITGKYGNSKHPTQSKVTINNHGIDISTTSGSIACCVFDGEVSTVFNTGKSNVVMVRHGLYFTLYANLDKVFVKSGDKVKTGDKIGFIHTNSTENNTVLHFEVWNDKEHTNPKAWLKQ